VLHAQPIPEERIQKLIMDWIPRPRKTWMEGYILGQEYSIVYREDKYYLMFAGSCIIVIVEE